MGVGCDIPHASLKVGIFVVLSGAKIFLVGPFFF